MDTTGGVYMITCEADGRFYVGRSIDTHKRWGDHLRDMRYGRHKNHILQKCYDKYGEDQMMFKLLYETPDAEEQQDLEQQILDQCIDMDTCANINRSAAVFCDVPWTETRKLKIKQAATGRKYPPRSDEFCRKLSAALKGHKLSSETRAKIAAAHRGKRLTEEQKRKIGRHSAGENNPMYGRKGADNPQSIPIYQLDARSIGIVEEHASAQQAADAVKGDASGIVKACKGKIRQIYGYLWCYKAEYPECINRLRENAEYINEQKHIKHGEDKPNARAVVQLDTEGGLVAEYPYLSMVAKRGFDPSSVVKACRGKIKQYRGYIWRYKEGLTTIPEGE